MQVNEIELNPLKSVIYGIRFKWTIWQEWKEKKTTSNHIDRVGHMNSIFD